jgi:ATP-dependent Zn protease
MFGLALLYGYRSQTPSAPTVAMTQAIQEINAGQVRKVTIMTGVNKATLELVSGEKHQTNLPAPDDVFQKAVLDYNAANPTRQIVLVYENNDAPFTVIGSIVLSLLPVLLVGGIFFWMTRQAQRR